MIKLIIPAFTAICFCYLAGVSKTYSDNVTNLVNPTAPIVLHGHLDRVAFHRAWVNAARHHEED